MPRRRCVSNSHDARGRRPQSLAHDLAGNLLRGPRSCVHRLDDAAQTAADAAALAAVAEVAPFGAGRQEELAREYAEGNGGRLVECRCVAGASAVQVTVALGAVEATARATLDPAMLGPGLLAFDGRGLHPVLPPPFAA